MSAITEIQELFGSGREADAAAMLEEAAGAGDEAALFMLANWRLFGIGGRRDPEEAHELLARAGSADALRLRAILVGNGTGRPADPEAARDMLRALPSDPAAARQLSLLDAMPPLDAVRKLAVSALSKDPLIWLIRGLLSEAECDYLIAAATPALKPSFVIDPLSGRRAPNPIRTSTGMNFDPTMEDLVVHAINRRIAAATATQVDAGELLQVLRYAPGQEYRPHLDMLTGVANQRDWTALVYLNDDYEDGETQFDRLGLAVKGKKGDALVFRNVTQDGRGDQRTRHAGLPVTKGEKWLATRWIRRGPYDPWNDAPS